MDLISVIIPVYNQTKELLAALESIKDQTYQNIEIIIVDDGSENKIKIKDLRFKINSQIPVTLIKQENRGAPAARNRGLEKARGEYVIFWDADVVGKSEMLEKMHLALQEHPEVNFAYCNYHLSSIIYHLPKKMTAQSFNFETLKQKNYIHSTSLIRRKDAIKWDENLKRFQDWDLWLTLAEQNKIGVYLPETLFTIIAKGSISSWLPSFAYQKPWKFLPVVRGKIKKYEEAREAIYKKHQINHAP